MVKKLLLLLSLGFFLTIPVFSQSTSDETITIKKVDLEKIVSQRVKKAVDDAVAIAVKDTESKYEKKLTDKDLEIAEKDGTIKKKTVEVTALTIRNDNLTTENNSLKGTKLGEFFEVGGISFAVGTIAGILIHIGIVGK